MIVFYCDKCKSEIEEPNTIDIYEKDMMFKMHHYQICDKCMKIIVDYLDNKKAPK